MLAKEESAVFLNVLALLAFCWSASKLACVQKVLIAQAPDGPHSYTVAEADPAQHGKKVSFVLGPTPLRYEDTSQGYIVPKDVSVHSVGIVVLWLMYLFGMFSSHSHI